jgi:hypothetical protein
VTPEEEFDAAPTPEAEFEAAPPAPPAEPLPPVVQPGPSDAEKRWGRIVSFLSGSPLFGTVADAAGALGVGGRGGSGLRRDAEQATEQFSPKVAGVPVLPVLGSVAATLPAGAARIGTLGLGASRAARVGLQGVIGAVSAADRGGDAGDVALGTGVGLVGGAGGELVGAGLSRAAEAVRPAATAAANRFAVKALLGGGTMVNRLKNQLGVTDEAGMQALGADVRSLGVLGAGPIPRSAGGINEAVQSRLASEGSEIGRIRELADALVASGKASPPDAVRLAQAYEAGVRGATRIADEAAVAPEVMARSSRLIEQATPKLGGVPTTEGGTFKGLWNQTSAMQRSAFSPMEPPATQAARKALERAGVQAARGDLARQMEGAVGPDEMRNLAESMRRYSTAARISDVVEDTAGRAAARNTLGLGDTQLAQTVGATGPVGLGVAGLSSMVRGRGDAAMALGLPVAGRIARPLLSAADPAARLGAPAVGRDVVNRSVADPLGPLRQYLELDPEEQKAASADAFRGAP